MSRDCVADAVFLLGQVSDVVTVRIHDYIAVRLLESHEDVHHFELALHDKRGVVEEAHGRVALLEDCIRIFWHVDRRDEEQLHQQRRRDPGDVAQHVEGDRDAEVAGVDVAGGEAADETRAQRLPRPAQPQA